MSILENEDRVGRFTSSTIHKLCKSTRRDMTPQELAAYKIAEPKGKRSTIDIPFSLSYVEEKNFERRLKRAIGSESHGRATEWGSMCEVYVFTDILGIEYKLSSQTTTLHPLYPDLWAGSIDTSQKGIISDIKCPFTMLSFVQLVGGGTIEAMRENSDAGDHYYWQMVSNACISGIDECEIVVFCPYKSEIQAIKGFASAYGLKWVEYANEYDLPWIHDGGEFQNVNKIRFTVPKEDKEFLTNVVLEAGRLLTPRK